MSEFYRLSWLQADISLAVTQDINALIDGVPTQLQADMEIIDSELDYIFPTDSIVEWWVTTNIRNVYNVDSIHSVFSATNRETS